MDDLIYPASLLAIVITAFSFFQSGNTKFALLVLAIGVYIIYSHETGHTATEYKNEMVDTINESAGNYSKKRGIERFDTNKVEKAVK